MWLSKVGCSSLSSLARCLTLWKNSHKLLDNHYSWVIIPVMIWKGSALAASWHPATPSFPHQPIFTASTNPFQFIALHTLSIDGNSLLFSFQQLTHSFPCHGTGHPAPLVSKLPVSAKSFIYRTCKKNVRNSFACRTYKNKGLITPLFVAHTKNTGMSLSSSQLWNAAPLSRSDRPLLAVEPSKRFKPCVLQISPPHQLQWNVPKELACR